MERGAWQAAVHSIAKSQTGLSTRGCRWQTKKGKQRVRGGWGKQGRFGRESKADHTGRDESKSLLLDCCIKSIRHFHWHIPLIPETWNVKKKKKKSEVSPQVSTLSPLSHYFQGLLHPSVLLPLVSFHPVHQSISACMTQATSKRGESLVVHWLRLSAFTAVGPCSIPGWGLRFHTLCGMARHNKLNKIITESCQFFCTVSQIRPLTYSMFIPTTYRGHFHIAALEHKLNIITT